MPIVGSGLSRTALASSTQKQGLSKDAPAHITHAVADASRRTGVSFSYLMTKASTESSFNPNAKAKTSSATGLYQFIDKTWLDMVDRHGATYGLGAMAKAITRRSDGSLVVADKATRQKILDLRKDPKVSALMAAEYASDNKKYLEKNLSRPVNDTDLYLAHFLGAGGATRFLKAMDKNPHGSAASIMPEAATANRPIFFSKNGQAKSLQQVYAGFDKKFDDGAGTNTSYASSDTPTQAGAVPNAPRPFLTTYLLAALDAPAESEKSNNQEDVTRSYLAGGLPIESNWFNSSV